MSNQFENENDLAHLVIGIAIEIHKQLGPGLDEEVYTQCLIYELKQQGINFEHNCKKDIEYKNLLLKDCYSVDFIINNSLVVEIETCEQITELHIQKILKSLRFGEHKLGLVINFNSPLLKNGIRRVSNNRILDEA